MGVAARVVMVVLALASSATIIRSLRKARMPLGFATTWVLLAVAVGVLGVGGDKVLDPVTRVVGVQYPPTLLFLIAILVLLLLTAYLSLKVAALEQQVREIADRYGRDHVNKALDQESPPPPE